MKIGSTQRILINFNTSLLTDLDSAAVLSLEAFLFVEQRPLLRFKKGGGTGWDGAIVKDPAQANVGIIRLTEELSNRLVPGKLKMEVWLKRQVGADVENYDFTVFIDHVEARIRP